MQSYIKRSYYNPCNLSHWAPKGKPDEMDFAGQCNDGIFRLSHTGKLKCVVGRLNALSDGQAHLESGESIHCDHVIVASGLKYNLTPDFLYANLGLGTLHTKSNAQYEACLSLRFNPSQTLQSCIILHFWAKTLVLAVRLIFCSPMSHSAP